MAENEGTFTNPDLNNEETPEEAPPGASEETSSNANFDPDAEDVEEQEDAEEQEDVEDEYDPHGGEVDEDDLPEGYEPSPRPE